MNRLGRAVRALSGEQSRSVVAMVVEQVDAALEGAHLIDAAAKGELGVTDARELMADVEHKGDDGRARLVGELSRTLSTPIDREDLFRLSRSVDDVLDNLYDLAWELELYDVPRDWGGATIMVPVIEGLQALRAATIHMVGSLDVVSTDALVTKKAGRRIRRSYQREVGRLFEESATMDLVDLLKRREVLRRLDVIGLRLGEAADALADGAVKRSH